MKTTENFQDYRFRLADGRYAQFRIVAAGTERDNNREQEGKERRFVLRADEPVGEEGGERRIRFEDLDALYFELVRFKDERGWSNLAIGRETVGALLADPSWYRLTIPAADLAFDGPEPLRRVRVWREIALAVLKKYVERYIKDEREGAEAPLREYTPVRDDETNFFGAFTIRAPEAQSGFLPTLRRIKAELEAGTFKEGLHGNLAALSFGRHLYNPLLYRGGNDIEIKPDTLNEGERDFLLDLKRYCDGNPGELAGTELYLLRNRARGKGIGFFVGGNFFPDFILWLLVGERQYISFIDPKGITRLEGLHDPKIMLSETIKQVERELNDPTVVLNSFIVSNSPYRGVAFWGTKEAFEARHVLFQREDTHRYIGTMIRTILADGPVAP